MIGLILAFPLLSALSIGILWRTGRRNDALFSGLSIAMSLLAVLFAALSFGKSFALPGIPGAFRNDLLALVPALIVLLVGIFARGAAYSRKHPGLLILMDLSTASALGFFLTDQFLGWAAFGFLLSLSSLLIVFSPVLEPRFQRSAILLGLSDLLLLLAAGASLHLGNPAIGPVPPAVLTLLLLGAIAKIAVFANPSELDESRQPPLPTFIHFAFPPLAGAYLLARLGTPAEPIFPWIIGLGVILFVMAIAFNNLEGVSELFLEGGGIRLGRLLGRLSRQLLDGAFSLLGLFVLAKGEWLKKTQTKALPDYLLVFAATVTILVSVMAFYLQRWL